MLSIILIVFACCFVVERTNLSSGVFLFFIFPGNLIKAQNDQHRPLTGCYNRYPWEGQWGLKGNLNYYKSLGFEFGLFVSDYPKRKDPDYQKYFGGQGLALMGGNQNLFLTSEFNTNCGLSIKIGYELNYFLIGGRISYLKYFEFTRQRESDYLLPEAGISLFGWTYLFYGYAVPLNSGSGNFSRHRVCLGINWGDFVR